MELKKKKYSQKEVKLILDAFEKVHQQRVSALREEIATLTDENKRLSDDNALLKNDEALVLATLKRAEKNANETDETIKLHYDLELEKLKKFSERWSEYFKALRSQYPLYPPIQNALSLVDAVNGDNEDSIQVVEGLIEQLDKLDGEMVDPKQKINDYIVATSDTGFDINQVLNPGELELEEICKELGLMEQKN